MIYNASLLVLQMPSGLPTKDLLALFQDFLGIINIFGIFLCLHLLEFFLRSTDLCIQIWLFLWL
jgi:hypothetical protein